MAPDWTPAPPDSDWEGTARYVVKRRIGEGGMGVVYEAFDRQLGRPVALKTLRRPTPASVYRLKNEFRTLAGVTHRNLVGLYELVATEGERIFFAMELVLGVDFLTYAHGFGSLAPRPLNEEMTPPSDPPSEPTAEGPISVLPPAAVNAGSPPVPRIEELPLRVNLGRLRPALAQLVDGVHALHASGRLHRDIKPRNVLVTPEQRVVLLDFGVATELARSAGRNLLDREVVGTARYMAPEQALEADPSPASDWYSVGVMLYEALVGEPPFSGPGHETVLAKALGDARPPRERVRGVPADLDALCCDLLRRDPRERPGGEEIRRRVHQGMRAATVSPAPRAGGDRAPSLPPPPPASAARGIGRPAQLADLRAAFEAARQGTPVTALVLGRARMGKTALVDAFLDEVSSAGEAAVLRGRAYERERVSYKAFDGVVDSLSRHVACLPRRQELLAGVSDLGALASLFPMMRQIPEMEGAPAPAASEPPQVVRSRAFAALRQLLREMRARQPLVVSMDDAQWGDLDSARLVLDLVQPPDAPAMLLVIAHPDEPRSATDFYRELRSKWPASAELREIRVEDSDTPPPPASASDVPACETARRPSASDVPAGETGRRPTTPTAGP
jgi:serine/threonine protein kinase